MIHKRLLVTGTMRVGTTWMAKALMLNGLDCPHERLGAYGCVSWFYFTDAPNYPSATAHKHDGRRGGLGPRRGS